jgi:ribosomal protein L10
LDLDPRKTKFVFDTTNATPEQLEELKRKMKQLGGRVREISDDEAKNLGL